MAKILYGLCGEGLGHASRSRILINHLKKTMISKLFLVEKHFYICQKNLMMYMKLNLLILFIKEMK